MARNRPFIRVAAAIVGGERAAAGGDGEGGELGQPANTRAEAATAWSAEKPAWRATNAERHRQDEADYRVGNAQPHTADERLLHPRQAR